MRLQPRELVESLRLLPLHPGGPLLFPEVGSTMLGYLEMALFLFGRMIYTKAFPVSPAKLDVPTCWHVRHLLWCQFIRWWRRRYLQ